MKTIISIRLKSEDPLKREQFIVGSGGTVQRKIINIIENDPYGDYDFLIQDSGAKGKYVRDTLQLQGEVINIVDESCLAEFTQDEEGYAIILLNYNEGALPQQHTLDQLKMIRKKSRNTDIGDKISDMNKQGANIQYIRNPVDTGVETFQDYERSNKKFNPNWNLKRLKPFRDYQFDQTTSDRPTRRKRKRK